MTDSYGPFDGAPFAEAQWYDYAPLWASPGVVGTPAASATTGPLAFTASGLSVSAGVGKAWIRGAGFSRTGTPPTHAVAANANASQSRRDRLVLRRNLASHVVETAVIQGTPSGSPVAPSLTQVDAGVWEEALFSFLVPPNNGTTITGVVDERVWIQPTGSAADIPFTPWTDGNGWTARPGNGYEVVNRWAMVNISFARASWPNGDVKIATLPVGARPARSRYFLGQWAGGVQSEIRIDANGDIVATDPGESGIVLSVSFPVA